MAQVLSYCSAKVFAHAILPLVLANPKPVASANDDEPQARLPCASR
jgi:hypothetical protein